MSNVIKFQSRRELKQIQAHREFVESVDSLTDSVLKRFKDPDDSNMFIDTVQYLILRSGERVNGINKRVMKK